ncbi:hypothetical protein AgCh_004530 [Apium graveolens]
MKNWEDPSMSEQERREFYKDGLHFNQLRNRYGARADTRDMDAAQIEVQCRVHTRAYMLFIIGGVLFPTSSRDVVHPRYMQLLMEESEIRDYAWGAAVLAHLYRSLTLSADRSVRTFNGCSLLLMLWAYERLAPGRPEIAPQQEMRWPRACAWAEPVKPYARLYEREADHDDVDATHFPVCRHMALGRIPLVAFEIIEYQYSDRVLRQFGMCQHIPDDPFDHAVLRLERQSSFQWPHRLAMHQQYVAEWESYVATGGPEIVEGGFVSFAEYMQWYRRVSKMRIARCVPPKGDIIQPRDWYPQQMMGDALESAMKMTYMIHMRGPPSWFYDVIPDFLVHYDRVMTEWKGLGYSRPAFIRPKDIQQPLVKRQPPAGDTREDETGGPEEDTAVLVPPKRPREEVQSTGDIPATHAPTHVSIPPQVEVQSTGDVPPATAPTPVSIASQVEVQSPADVPPTTAPTPVSIPPQVDYTTSTPFHRSMTFQPIPLKMPITPESLEASSSLITPYVHLGIGKSSVPSELRDMFDMDSIEDLAEDAAKRGGPERRGDMTRPLKNQKVRWLYRHFWSLEVDYIWRDHSERGITYPLTHSQVTTLRPEFWVEDDVLNAYGELLRLKEDKLWEKWEKIPRTESFKPRRYFIAPSFFMAMVLEFCPNLKKKLIPYMLNYLHPSRFPLKYTRVHGLDARPKQDGGNDCGVYVSKYMDAMLNGISLPSAVWNPKVDVQTFRYRMAHELSKGVARHISEWGIRQREAGH